MWPNEFATMLVDLSGATGQMEGAVIMQALLFWYVVAIVPAAMVIGAVVWEVLGRREAKKRSKV